MRSIARWRAGVVDAVALLVAAVAAASCSGSGAGQDAGTPGDATYFDRVVQEPMPVDVDVADASFDGGLVDGAQCASAVESHTDEGAQHIPCTSPASYISEPPSSGDHYPNWPEPGVYDMPIPWGNLVHALEHGGIVIVYNCPAGCADDVSRAEAFIAALAPDPVCGAAKRVILAPDPTLPWKFAASAWTWTLRSDCFDEAAFTQFFAAHFGHGREDVCGGYPVDQLCPQ